jgi:hypothetical protein
VYVGGSVQNSAIGDHNVVRNNRVTTAPTPPPVAARTAPVTVPADPNHDYDLAFSFASPDRGYVEATKLACERLGLRVMYDQDLSTEWWGADYLTEQRTVYGQRTRFFVPFISPEYFRRPIPADEFRSALWTDLEQGGGYILPVLIGDVDVPPEKLHPQTGHLRAEAYTPEALAAVMAKKVGAGGDTDRPEPRPVDGIVGVTLGLRLPKVSPRDFSRYQERDVVRTYLGERFEQALPALREADCVGTVRRTAEFVRIWVERSGRTVYSLEIHERGHGDCELYFHRGFQTDPGTAYQASAAPFFNLNAGRPALRVVNLSLLDTPPGKDLVLTKEELFDQLWTAMVRHIEANV